MPRQRVGSLRAGLVRWRHCAFRVRVVKKGRLELTADRDAAPTAVLFDPTGKVGHAGARTTLHMYVINGEGALVYKGGIDDQPTARLQDLKGAS